MKTRLSIIVPLALTILIGLTSMGGWANVAAQTPEPTPVVPGDKPVYEGSYEELAGFHPRTARAEASVSSEQTAASDNFGYTRNDSAGYSWIDISSGTPIDFGTSLDDNYDGPINLGFEFKFYENAYTQVYISTNGVLTFGSGGAYARNELVPLDTAPNNLIAPFWDDLALEVSGSSATGKVYYALKGSKPNRYFVVQWQDVTRRVGGGDFTFQALLYENGDVKFQYKTLNGDTGESTVGIEDADGIDGLLYTYNDPSGLAAGKAILFDRPDPEPRVKFLSTYQSAFAYAGKSSFSVQIRNTGESGSDTYELFVGSDNPDWDVRLYNANNSALLTDSDKDGTVDSGAIAQGAYKTINVWLLPPSTNEVGDSARVVLTARSSKNALKEAQIVLVSAVPAPFAQAYADSEAGIRVGLIWKHQEGSSKIADWFSGSTLALGQTSQGNYVYTWEKNGSKLVDNALLLYSDIEYALVSKYGSMTKVPQKLTDNFSGEQSITDRSPVVAGAPNGKIGVAWIRTVFKADEINSNVYFAVLGAEGNLVHGPVNITQNSQWRGEGVYNVPIFLSPRIVSTSDNRFAITWVEQRVLSSAEGSETSNIFLSILDTSGSAVKPKTNLTNSDAGETRYFDPALSGLTNARFFLAYTGSDSLGSSSSIYFRVMASSGSQIHPHTQVSGSNGWGADAAQLKSGKVVLAWANGLNNKIAYATLNGSTFAIISAPKDLDNPNARQSDYVSVTKDSEGHAVITWMDFLWNNYLYYALVDDAGSMVTPPMVFLTGQSADPLVLSSYAGQGNAPYDGGWQTFIPLIKR